MRCLEFPRRKSDENFLSCSIFQIGLLMEGPVMHNIYIFLYYFTTK